jgi:outer membrane protein OmpA-like peptidoglycan-associated protein
MRTSRVPLAWAATLILLAIASGPAKVDAQFGGIRDAARRAAEEAKKAADARRQAEEAKKEEPEAAQPAPAPAASSQPAAAASTDATQPAGTAPGAPAFEAYSKYDFVPGEKVVALDDFTQDEIGDFPARWNTNGSGEIVTIAGKTGRWLKMTKGGFFLPEFVTELPENFTIEFDLTVAPTFDSGYMLNVALVQLADLKAPAPWQSSDHAFTLQLNPRGTAGSSAMTTRQGGTSGPANNATSSQLSVRSAAPIHVSMWRQRQRVRVYINQEKAWDVPRAIAADATLNSLIFFLPAADDGHEYYVGNVRLATGAPDTRNKILTEGRWVTRGILFDVGSDRLRGESYGSLKEIANVLTESADLEVRIVGHTDSDGDEAANLDLSRRRAAAVKTALAAQFGIDAGRLDTDGRGESQPAGANDTPAGKANNRRVEFIRK